MIQVTWSAEKLEKDGKRILIELIRKFDTMKDVAIFIRTNRSIIVGKPLIEEIEIL